MENIMETILAYILAQDLYTLIALGALIVLLFVVVIYKVSQKPTTTFLENIRDEDIYEDDVFDDNTSSDDVYQNFPQHKTLNDTPTQMSEGGSRMTWLIIDGVAILTFTVISYVLIFKNMWVDEETIIVIAKTIVYNIVFYYALIKPTLFNTKPKK